MKFDIKDVSIDTSPRSKLSEIQTTGHKDHLITIKHIPTGLFVGFTDVGQYPGLDKIKDKAMQVLESFVNEIDWSNKTRDVW